MKYLRLILLIIVLICMVSCGGDECPKVLTTYVGVIEDMEYDFYNDCTTMKFESDQLPVLKLEGLVQAEPGRCYMVTIEHDDSECNPDWEIAKVERIIRYEE